MSLILPPFSKDLSYYTRQVSSKVRQHTNYVKKLPYYFTIPVFNIENTWRGSSEIVRKYSYSFVKNFSLLDFLPSPDGNYIPCISWRGDDNSIARYKLWYRNDGLLYVPDYDGRTIAKDFYLEIWSTNNAIISGGGSNLKISQFKIPTILCESGEINLNPSYSTCFDMIFNLEGFSPSSGGYYRVINTCLDTELIE